jgi:iron complex outermembrane receptor protein
MKVVTKSRLQSQRRTTFQLNPVAAGCAALVFGLSAQALAQTAAPEMETVTVSGIRTGIEAAISIKKNSSSIVEAISAEDIGKLPDASVAESIARLPGVTAQRSRSTGKAADISVRGLSPSFNGSLLNGREQASTGNARSPEFDLFPAELIGSAVIYKSPDATLIGQGLAATIDLHTVQPLDFSKRVMAVNYRRQTTGIDSGGTEGKGNRLSLSYVDQFADRTIGLAIGFTKAKDTGGEQQKFDSWGGWAADVPYNGVNVKTPGGFTADTETRASNRDGVSATLQFRPNKDFKSTIDVFRSSGSTSLKKTGLEGAIGGQSAGTYDPAGILTNATIANGVATSGTITNYKGVVRNHMEKADDTLTSIGWNSTLKLNEWTAVADLSHSTASKQSSRYETTAGQAGNATNLGSISWTGFNGGNFTDVKYNTSLNYSDRAVAKLTDVDGWGGGVLLPQAGYVALPNIDDKVDGLRLSARRDLELGPIVAAQFGVNFNNREKSRVGQEGRLVVTGNDPYGAVAMPGTATSTAGTTGLPVASWDPSGSLGSIYSLARWVDASVLNKDWSVHERVNTAYVMGDLDGTLGSLPYRGNIGAQIIHTDQSATGYNVDLAKCVGITPETCPSTTVTGGKTYTDVLPSMNLSFNLGSDQVMRLGVAKVLSRANMDDMRASQSFSVNTNGPVPILTGTGGNPTLEPFRAKSFDLSYEKYFGKKGYFSAAAFYKKLDSYILRTPRNYDFTPYISANTPLPLTGPYKGSAQGFMTAPFNGDGGNIHGFELALNIPFSLITPVLDGFGVMVNYSDTSSQVTLPAISFATQNIAAQNIPLPGLSKQVTNLRLYYEAHGFQIAAAARKRSDFLGEISDFQDNQQLTFIKGETIVDLQASYEFQSGWLKGLTLLLQGNNMTNTPFQQFDSSPDVIINKVKYGKTYLVGLNLKY